MSITFSPSPSHHLLSRRRLGSLLRAALTLGVSAPLGFAVAIALAVTIPSIALGYRSLAVLSGSMAPALQPGDLVVDSQITPLEARVGDIVSFRDPQREQQLVTHRVREIRIVGARAFFVTQGDANTGVERWTIPVGGTLGRVEYRIPNLGHLTNRLGDRAGRIALVVIPAFLLCLLELWRIWRPERRRHEGPESAVAAVAFVAPAELPRFDALAVTLAHPDHTQTSAAPELSDSQRERRILELKRDWLERREAEVSRSEAT